MCEIEIEGIETAEEQSSVIAEIENIIAEMERIIMEQEDLN